MSMVEIATGLLASKLGRLSWPLPDEQARIYTEHAFMLARLIMTVDTEIGMRVIKGEIPPITMDGPNPVIPGI